MCPRDGLMNRNVLGIHHHEDMNHLVNRDASSRGPEPAVGPRDITYVPTWAGWVYAGQIQMAGRGLGPSRRMRASPPHDILSPRRCRNGTG